MIYDVIIIGGGAGGCSAGIYASRKKLKTLLITKDFLGQISTTAWVENYPAMGKVSGFELATKFQKHLESFEVDIKTFETVLGLQKNKQNYKIITDKDEYIGKSVIVASGRKPKKLNADNEDKFIGKGVSYCVTCDGAFFENKIVSVVGGGNAGLEACVELARFAKKVYLFEYLDYLQGDGILQDEVKNKSNVEIIVSAYIKSFVGENNLQKIIYLDRKQDKQKEINVNGCFIEIGAVPNTDFVKGELDLNEKNEIIVDPITLQTSAKGVFGAGDVINFPYKQVIIASSQGAISALSAFQYITKK